MRTGASAVGMHRVDEFAFAVHSGDRLNRLRPCMDGAGGAAGEEEVKISPKGPSPARSCSACLISALFCIGLLVS